jgi:PAS domain S-box-containing protein
MNLFVLCGILNIITVVFAIAIALIVTRKYKTSFVIPWVNAHASVVILLGLQLFPSFELLFPFEVLQLIMALAEGWFFLRTADSLQGKNYLRRESLIVGSIFFVSLVMLLLGIPFKTVAALPVLMIGIAIIRLGLLFFKPIDFLGGRGYVFWLGLPLIVMASMIPFYPWIHGRFDWLADIISSFMHVLGGVGMAIFVLDQNNHEMAQAKRRYQDLFEQGHDGILLLDSSGMILDLNAAACSLFAASKESLVQHRLATFFTADSTAGFEHLSLDDTLLREAVLNLKEGSSTPVEISVKNIGNGIWEAIIRDISERKRVTELQKQRVEDLLQADQTKDSFLTLMSTQLARPLVEVKELSSLLPDNGLDSLQARIGRLRENSERMLKITEDLQHFAKTQGGFKMYPAPQNEDAP